MSSNLPAGNLIILGLSVFVSMLGVGIIVPFLPLYAKSLGANGLMMGVIFSAFSASRAVVMPYVGGLSDRVGRKPFLLLGLGGYMLTSLTLLAIVTPQGLVLNRALQGVFAAMILPVAMALVAELAPDGREGQMFGWFNTAFLMGIGVGPLIGGVVYDSLGVKSNFLLMAGLSLVSLLMVLAWVREPPHDGKELQARGYRAQLALLGQRGLLAVFLARAGHALGMGCFIAFLPLLGESKGLAGSQVGVLLAVNVLVMTALQAPAGWLADRLPRVPLAMASQSLAALSKACLPLMPGMHGLMVLAVLEGIGSGLALPPLTALAVAHGRQRGVGMGLTMGLFGLALSTGIFMGPVMGGLLTDWWGVGSAFYLAGVGGCAGALALGLLHWGHPPPTARQNTTSP